MKTLPWKQDRFSGSIERAAEHMSFVEFTFSYDVVVKVTVMYELLQNLDQVPSN